MYMNYIVNVLGFLCCFYGGPKLYAMVCFRLGDGCVDRDGGGNTGGCGQGGCGGRYGCGIE